jgi:predicted AlkP superfamily phosphohydrolase/phosphomutase
MSGMTYSRAVVVGLDAAVASLVEHYLAAGQMPNLSRLLARGGFTRARSVFPGVTPINWATVSTGAYPGTHGITDFAVLEPGDSLQGGRDAFVGASYRAETLWQAACQAGLSAATLNFPGAEAQQHSNHLWIAGRGSPSAVTPYALRNTACLATEPYAAALRDATLIERRGQRAWARLAPAPGDGSGPVLTFEVQRDGVLAGSEASSADRCLLRPGLPGPWMWGDFVVAGERRRGSYRLELVRFDPDQAAFAITVSQVTDPREIAHPTEMGPTLVSTLGPFIGYCGARGYDRGWSSAERMVDDGRYKGLWLARAARQLVARHGYHLVMLKWHLLDHLQHAIWGGFDPISPWYEPAQAPEAARLIAAGYAAADEMIGEVIPLLDQGVTLVVVSDHGHLPHLKAVSLNNLFAQQGLIQTLPGSGNPPPIDWAGTQAYGGPALGHIWLNVRGRQLQGAVDPAGYDAMRERVIALLLELRDPATGVRPVTRAVRREEAAPMGLWGERVGDVVYWMAPGYSGDFNWSPLSADGTVIYDLAGDYDLHADYGEGKFIAHKFQSVHGCGDPAAALGRGTEEAILAMAGPGIRAGASLDAIPDLTSVAPTLCRATGLPRPAQAEGAVLEAWLAPESD